MQEQLVITYTIAHMLQEQPCTVAVFGKALLRIPNSKGRGKIKIPYRFQEEHIGLYDSFSTVA
jgi:hypothetical protein